MFLIVVFRYSFQGSEDQLDQGQKISWREIGRVHAGLQIVRRREAIQLSEDSCGIDSY